MTPDYQALTVYCVVQFGFLGCPDAKKNATLECRELKELVATQEKCGTRVGDRFIIEPDFFYKTFQHKTAFHFVDSDVTASTFAANDVDENDFDGAFDAKK